MGFRGYIYERAAWKEGGGYVIYSKSRIEADNVNPVAVQVPVHDSV